MCGVCGCGEWSITHITMANDGHKHEHHHTMMKNTITTSMIAGKRGIRMPLV